MAIPALRNKALIAKGVFAVSVVAITATVGVVSFAQAARPFDNGYNGYGGDAIQMAVEEFQNSVQDATQTLNNDINVCLGTTQADASARSAANTFKADANTSAHNLSAQFASPSKLSRDTKVMQNKLNAAATVQDRQLTASLTQVNTSNLHQCLSTASNTFHTHIISAQHTLLAAIHDAIH
jgi:hypothetical protein